MRISSASLCALSFSTRCFNADTAWTVSVFTLSSSRLAFMKVASSASASAVKIRMRSDASSSNRRAVVAQ